MKAEQRVAEQRVYEIDLLRFIAALVVMLYHYTYRSWAWGDGTFSAIEFPVIGPWFDMGYLGVDLFFLISGFVIAMTMNNRTASQFAISRFVRLYPAYWFCLLLSAVVIALFGGSVFSVTPQQVLVNLTMLQEVFGVKHVEGVYWSLLVELKFYVLMLLLLAFGQKQRLLTFLSVWLGLTLVQYFTGGFPALQFFLMPEYASYFISGALFCMAMREGWTARILLLLLASYVSAMLWAEGRVLVRDVTSIRIVVTGMYLLMLAVTLGWFKPFARKGLMQIGLLTYPLYLIHQIIGYLILNQLAGINRFLALGLVCGLMIGLAYAIAQYVERPIASALKVRLTDTAHGLFSGRVQRADS